MLAGLRIPPYVALLPVFAGVFVAADDQTVVVTVLPQIMVDMKVPVADLDRAAWTITGYLLGYVAAMPLVGRLSDTWGHRRLYILSLLLFMGASVLVAVSPNLPALVAARIVQAVGAGAMLPISIAIMGDLFPPERRGIPMGLMGASAEAGGVIGPLWGGLIIRYLDWPWVFWINIPLGALVLVGVLVLLKPSPRTHARVDYAGGALMIVSLATLTLGLARVDSRDWIMALYFVVFVLSSALFILRQRTGTEPLLPASIFRVVQFRAANATHLLVGGALIIGMVTIPLMANTVLGLTPLDGGLLLVRMTAGIPVGAIIGGLACQRTDYRVPTIAGVALAAAGFGLMSSWDLNVADPAMTIHLVTAGVGFGLLIAPIALAATNTVEEMHRGSAAAVITASRLVGMTAGLAALTAWGSARFDGLVAGIQLPFALPGETAAESQQRALDFGTQVNEAGLTLFSNFFLVAMVLCLIAVVPATAMRWRSGRTLT